MQHVGVWVSMSVSVCVCVWVQHLCLVSTVSFCISSHSLSLSLARSVRVINFLLSGAAIDTLPYCFCYCSKLLINNNNNNIDFAALCYTVASSSSFLAYAPQCILLHYTSKLALLSLVVCFCMHTLQTVQTNWESIGFVQTAKHKEAREKSFANILRI